MTSNSGRSLMLILALLFAVILPSILYFRGEYRNEELQREIESLGASILLMQLEFEKVQTADVSTISLAYYWVDEGNYSAEQQIQEAIIDTLEGFGLFLFRIEKRPALSFFSDSSHVFQVEYSGSLSQVLSLLVELRSQDTPIMVEEASIERLPDFDQVAGSTMVRGNFVLWGVTSKGKPVTPETDEQ